MTAVEHNARIDNIDKQILAIRSLRSEVCSITERLENGPHREPEPIYHLLSDIVDCVEDMIWAKDKSNKFTYANKALRDNILLSDSLHDSLGRDCTFFAEREHNRGNKYTFGSACCESDEVVMKENKTMYFLQTGYVSGREIKLMVRKGPRHDTENNVIGTVGMARDVTDDYEILQSIGDKISTLEEKAVFCANTDKESICGNTIIVQKASQELKDYMNRYTFMGQQP